MRLGGRGFGGRGSDVGGGNEAEDRSHGEKVRCWFYYDSNLSINFTRCLRRRVGVILCRLEDGQAFEEELECECGE